MRIQITNQDKRLKTRITFSENLVRIDSMIFADHAIARDTDPCVQRKWKDKWFVKSTVLIPNAHVVSLLNGFIDDESMRKQMTDWVCKIVEQDREKRKEDGKS